MNAKPNCKKDGPATALHWSFVSARMLAFLVLLRFNNPAQAQPTGLTKVDIADPSDTPAVSQVVNNANGSFTVIAGGNDTWGSSDSFTFLYEQKDGDFDVSVQVVNVQVDDPAE